MWRTEEMHSVLVQKPLGKTQEETGGLYYNTASRKDMGMRGLDCPGLGYGKVADCFKHGNGSSTTTRCGSFLN